METNFKIEIIDKITIKVNGEEAKLIHSRNRSVWKYGDYVIKIDSYYSKEWQITNQCESEYKTWELLKNTEYAKYLAPVVQYGLVDDRPYEVQVCVNVDEFDNPSDSLYEQWVEDIMSILRKVANIRDLHDENFVARNSDHAFIVFDYGFSGNDY